MLENKDSVLNDKHESTLNKEIVTMASDECQMSGYLPLKKEEIKNMTELQKYDYETIRDTQETGTQGRSWFERTFKSYNNATLRSGIITLILTAKGVGCLSIPYTFAFLGMVPATAI